MNIELNKIDIFLKDPTWRIKLFFHKKNLLFNQIEQDFRRMASTILPSPHQLIISVEDGNHWCENPHVEYIGGIANNEITIVDDTIKKVRELEERLTKLFSQLVLFIADSYLNAQV